MKIDELSGEALAEACALAQDWHWHDGRGTAGPSYWEDAEGEFVHLADYRPDRDIAQAWELLRAIRDSGFEYEVGGDSSGSYCSIHDEGMTTWEIGKGTDEEAICRAWLKVRGWEGDHEQA